MKKNELEIFLKENNLLMNKTSFGDTYDNYLVKSSNNSKTCKICLDRQDNVSTISIPGIDNNFHRGCVFGKQYFDKEETIEQLLIKHFK